MRRSGSSTPNINNNNFRRHRSFIMIIRTMSRTWAFEKIKSIKADRNIVLDIWDGDRIDPIGWAEVKIWLWPEKVMMGGEVREGEEWVVDMIDAQLRSGSIPCKVIIISLLFSWVHTFIQEFELHISTACCAHWYDYAMRGESSALFGVSMIYGRIIPDISQPSMPIKSE